MKKIMMTMTLFILVGFVTLGVNAGNIKFSADIGLNDTLEFQTNPQAIIVEGRTLIPLRSVAENLNMTVDYGVQPGTDDAYIRIWNSKIALDISIKTNKYRVHNYMKYSRSVEGARIVDYVAEVYDLEYPLIIKDGRSYVPIRLLSEVFGFDNLTWEGSTRTISFKYSEYYSQKPIYDLLALPWNYDELANKRRNMSDIEIEMDKRFHNLVPGTDRYKTEKYFLLQEYQSGRYDKLMDCDGNFIEKVYDSSNYYEPYKNYAFNIGDRVMYGSVINGTVIAITKSGDYMVSWDNKYHTNNPSRRNIESLDRFGIRLGGTSVVPELYLGKSIW